MEDLAKRLSDQRGIEIDLNMVNGADHFYTNKLRDVSQLIEAYIKKRKAGPN